MFILPYGRILIEPIEDNATLKSTDRQYKRVGKVIGVYEHPELGMLFPKKFGIVIGDIIFFDEFAYRRFEHEGKDYCVVDVSDGALWGIIRPDDTQTEPLSEQAAAQMAANQAITNNERPL